MRKQLFCGLVGASLCLSAAQAAEPELYQAGLASHQASAMMGLSPQEAANVDNANATVQSEDSGVYLRFNVGGNFVGDADVTEFGFSNTSVSFNTGLDLGIAVGIPFGENFAFEVSLGYQYNNIESASGIVVVQNVGVGSLSSASGSVSQMPLMANIRYDFNLSESLTLGINAGVGIERTTFKLTSVGVTVPGAGTQIIAGNDSASDTNFRFGVRADLGWELSDTMMLGAYVGYGVSSAGSYDGTNVSSLENLAIGGMFSFEF